MKIYTPLLTNRFILQATLLFLCFFPFTICNATVEITDHNGITHTFSRPFTRIISLYPAHTENLAQLGAKQSLIGISTTDNYPRHILDIKRYSYHDSIEKFIQAAPDCILIRPMIRNSAGDLIQKLEEYGITVISLQPTSPEELYTYWSTLGLISGRSEEATEMINSFKDSLNQLRKKVAVIPNAKRKRVYFESIHSRMKTFSPDSITTFCLESAGGVNVATDAVPRRNTNIAGYSKERIISHAGSIDVFLAQKGRMNPVTIEDITQEPGFRAIKAIRDNRVFLVEETLVSRPTTRLLEGMAQIHELLYPTGSSQLQ